MLKIREIQPTKIRAKFYSTENKVIEEITDKKGWNAILQEIEIYDFYHTYDYHMLSKQTNENCVLLVYRKDAAVIAIPFIIRPINGTSYYDITSVYGYAGPISKNIPEDFDNTSFSNILNDYLINKKIVSVFSRLNPFIDHQEKILKNIGDRKEISSVVAIDLSNDLAIQRQEYQRRMKSQINKARRVCDIKKAETKEDIEAFIDIYYENMDRVNANESYYFDRTYFYDFLASDDFNTEILLAVCKETRKNMAGALFVKTNHIVQYHLGGTKEDFLSVMPIKMLIDEMRIIATENDFKFLNLGGGYRGMADSLLRFKMSFSKKLKPFNIWRHIVDTETYYNLSTTEDPTDSDYFPAYRSSAKNYY